MQGLSPRVRGNPLRVLHRLTARRSIPARAGEPLPKHIRGRKYTVYPRACGGTVNGVTSRRLLSGLSPRVRGNRIPSWFDGDRRRSIPARAGEPYS